MTGRRCVWALLALYVLVVGFAVANPTLRPETWREVGRLVPGDQFDHHDGNRYLIVGNGFEPMKDGPDEVVAAELGTGRLQKFHVRESVRWVIKSRQAVRDWDDERGRE